MSLIFDGIRQAFLLIIHGDIQMLKVAGLSLLVSGIATVISLLIGIPLGVVIGLNKFPGKRFIASLINAG
ncbi:MAG TPA: hypothetical protein VEH58_05050, partial [Dehalococcoidales bacterium]|nr:hypothetical protein [Dehalococcoidales bacterium]